MTSYLNHGVEAKMCETTPFVTGHAMLLLGLDLSGPVTLYGNRAAPG